MIRFRKARLAILATTVLVGIVLPAASSLATGPAGGDPAQRRGRAAQRRPTRTPQPPARAEAVRFSHRVEAHRRACDSCHQFPSGNWQTVRTGDAAFPDVTDYPKHASCLECHRSQFFARERPAPRICAVCHVAVTPQNTARLPFANPSGPFVASEKGSAFISEFRVSFPHETHIALLGAVTPRDTASRYIRVAARVQDAAKDTAVCATCHQTYTPQGDSRDEFASTPPSTLGTGFWLKKGTFKTSPDSHAGCFTCHSADSGMKPAPSDCSTCHKLAPAGSGTDFDAAMAAAMGVDPIALQSWRRRNSSATFRHEGGLHTEVACTSCHDVATMDTTDDRTTAVRVPSCGGDMGCHVTATLDEGGILNAELDARKRDASFRCAKCHLTYSTAPAPQGHIEAISRLAQK